MEGTLLVLYNRTINYILEFLLNGNEYVRYVGYSKDSTEWKNYKVVIVPSSFLEEHKEGKVQMPQLPLQQFEGMPILFGEPKVEQVNDTLVIYADLVASACFLLSRYEETLTKERDAHGRFSAKDSLAYKANFLLRPLVDEYGEYLRLCLRNMGVEVPDVPKQPTVTLTHDVDVPFEHRTMRAVLGGIKRGEWRQVLHNAFSSLEKNTAYTFPWLLEQDALLPNAQQIYFLRMPLQPCAQDKPYLSYQSADMQALLRLLKEANVTLGLHTSYASGVNAAGIAEEKAQLEKVIGFPVLHNRHHFLRTCSPLDMQALADAGILHDYTLGFADQVGFRIGTARPVRFINPVTLKVTPLCLHPLLVMDATLFSYMNLSVDAAFACIEQLAAAVKAYGGEFVLLWHNTGYAQTEDDRAFYEKIIQYLVSTFASQQKNL